MDTLGTWSRRWQLSFNIDKCLVLSVKDCVSRLDYYLDGRRLENVNSHPYLGIEALHRSVVSLQMTPSYIILEKISKYCKET